MQVFRHIWTALCCLPLCLSAKPLLHSANPPPPTANFTATVLCETDSVTFLNQSTMGSQMVYAWDFGDGNLSHAIHPRHLYPATGIANAYTVTLIATDTLAGMADTFSMSLTTYPRPFGFISRAAPHGGDTLLAGVPISFFSNASGTVSSPPTTYFWDFTDGQSSTAADPDSIYLSLLGNRMLHLTIANGTCVFDTTDSVVVVTEPIFAGGMLDGAAYGGLESCVPEQVFVGGPFDGAGNATEVGCAPEQVFVGGPYDGAGNATEVGCAPEQVFVGGPYDGAGNATEVGCAPEQVFVGGPYDGAGNATEAGCAPEQVFVGGPYDGAGNATEVGCPPDPVFAGGPFDGADMADEGIVAEIIQGNDTLCFGDSVTLAGILTDGGMATSWTWSTGDSGDTITIAPLASGWYTVTATLSNFCVEKTADIFLHVVDTIPVDAGPDLLVCDSQYVLIGTPMAPGPDFLWTPATGLSDPALAQPIASASATTNYVLTAYDPVSSCPIGRDSMALTVLGANSVTAGNDSSLCPGDSLLLLASGAYSYIWFADTAVFSPTGLTNTLPPTAFSASSGSAPSDAHFSNPFGWLASTNNSSQYIEVDLGTVTPLHRIGSRGAPVASTWVSSYRLSYSNDGLTWFDYRTGPSPSTFSGNSDSNTPVFHELTNLISARFLRFHPLTWAAGGIGMRIEAFTAPELFLGNPYPASAAGDYIVHGDIGTCGPVGTDTISLSSDPEVAFHYRSRRNGLWTDVTVWQVFDTVSALWVDAELYGTCQNVSYPTSASRTIQVGHEVAYDRDIPIGVDQVQISPSGHLTIPDTVALLLVDGPGSDFPAESNGRDIDNLGYFEIAGAFNPGSGASLVNDNLSVVHYSGGPQTMWNGRYGWLYVDGPGAIGSNTKALGGANTYVRTGLHFINAKIELGNQNLELHAGASLLNPGQNSGYMIATNNGFCIWNYSIGLAQSHLFPLGGAIYSPATITFDTVVTAGTLLGRVREMQHPTRFTIFRYWTMELGSMSFSGFYDGRFQYDHADLPTAPVTLADELAQVETGGAYNPAYAAPGGWRLSPVDLSNTLDLIANTGTIRNDSFSDFTFMPPPAPLAAELLSFDGRWKGEDGYLHWRAENEGELERYVLERSIDGWLFDSVFATLPHIGPEPVKQYAHLDRELKLLPEDVFYYRLRMVDLDGQVSHSNTVALARAGQNGGEYLTIFPNPSHLGRAFELHCFLREALPTEISLYDAYGKPVFQSSQNFAAGLNKLQIPTEQLSAGAYFIQVINQRGVKRQKLVVIR